MKTTKYKFDERTIKIPDHNYDINLKLPNGKTCLFQYRNEFGSIDLCFNHTVEAVLWENENLQDAKPSRGTKNIFPISYCNAVLFYFRR